MILTISIGFTILIFGTYLMPLVSAEILIAKGETTRRIVMFMIALGVASSSILVIVKGIFMEDEE